MECAANSRAADVTSQKLAYIPVRARNHWYSNCRPLQASASAAPRPGKAVSQARKIGRGSKIAKASNASALIDLPEASEPSTAAAAGAARLAEPKVTNERRSNATGPPTVTHGMRPGQAAKNSN